MGATKNKSGIYNWRTAGSICIWRYLITNKSYAGYHLAFDRQGLNAFLQLLDLLIEAGQECKKTISVNQSTDLLNIPKELDLGNFISWDKLVLLINERDFSSVRECEDKIILELGSKQISELIEVLSLLRPHNEQVVRLGRSSTSTRLRLWM